MASHVSPRPPGRVEPADRPRAIPAPSPGRFMRLELREGFHRCPAHPDRRPSLSIRREADRWLLHCFAGCEPEAVLRAAGLTWTDLYPDTLPRPISPRRQSWRGELRAPLIARERRVQRKLEPWIPVYRISDFIRCERQQIGTGRALASTIGDLDHVWGFLNLIATRERFISSIEAELDAALECY
jgi:hypothetical protein